MKSTMENRERKIYGVYIRSILNQKILLSINEIGKNIKQNLEQKIISKNEGRCISEGFIRPNSVRIISYSSGVINSEYVEFQTVFECMVCHPVEGQKIECVVKTVTKAGIHAEVVTDDIVPVVVFVARDHHNTNKYFNAIKENAKITISVIGVRFELNDPYICVIGQLINPEYETNKERARQKAGLSRLTLGEELGEEFED